MRSNNSVAIDVKIDGFILEENSYFRILGLSFSTKLDWGSYNDSIAKNISKKIETLISCLKFLSPEVAFYFFKGTIRPCKEFTCLWRCIKVLFIRKTLDKLQKWVFRTVTLSLTTSLEPFIVEMYPVEVFFIGVTLADVYLNCLNWFHSLLSWRSTRYSYRWHINFLSYFLDDIKI